MRPPTRPLTDSRSLRVLVERGSMAYSAVTQPWPEPLRQRGTPGVKLAVHSTRVRPNSTSTLPSGCSRQPRVSRTSRSWSGARPSWRQGRRVAGLVWVTAPSKQPPRAGTGPGAGGPARARGSSDVDDEAGARGAHAPP